MHVLFVNAHTLCMFAMGNNEPDMFVCVALCLIYLHDVCNASIHAAQYILDSTSWTNTSVQCDSLSVSLTLPNLLCLVSADWQAHTSDPSQFCVQ